MAIGVTNPPLQQGKHKSGAPPRSTTSNRRHVVVQQTLQQQQQQQNGYSNSHHFNATPSNAVTTTTTLPRPMALRDRSDSTGSTRGAFGPLPTTFSPTKKPKSPARASTTPKKQTSGVSMVVSPDGTREFRKKKKRTPKKPIAHTPSPEKLIGAEMDLSDMASLAMAGMNDHDELLGSIVQGNTSKPSPPTPGRPPHPFADEDSYFRYDSSPNKSTSLVENDTEAPLPFFEQIKKYGKPLGHDSLRYSDANMDAVVSSLKLNGGETSPPNDGFVSRQVSLFGTQLLEESERDVISQSQTVSYGSVMEPSLNVKTYGGGGSYSVSPEQRQQEIARFSSLVQESAYAPPPDNGAAAAVRITPPTPVNHGLLLGRSKEESYEISDYTNEKETSWQDSSGFLSEDATAAAVDSSWWNCCLTWLDPMSWVNPVVCRHEDGSVSYEEPSGYGSQLARNLLYTPEDPEFTSLQQFMWALFLGTFMGVYTAFWKNLIEYCVEFTWKTIPERLYEMGVFTDLDGAFPLPHYMWLCPSIFAGILSYVFVILPKQIPGQNEWIKSLHARGVQDSDTFLTLFFLSTAGMASGLSLGPELPLILTGGMIGSHLGVVTRQSILSARAMNLTAASAAVAGFFGFPMAGALFVLEVPHRMGLQYFEALSPATIASIVAVLVNRMILKNDVTGYYDYPFLTTTLPSHIFYIAIVYGLVGAVVGVFYCDAVKKLKVMVHDWFHVHHENEAHDEKETSDKESDEEAPDQTDESFQFDGKELRDVEQKTKALHAAMDNDEGTPLVRMDSTRTQKTENKKSFSAKFSPKKWLAAFGIAHEPTRAAVAGTLAGFLTGVTCMFVPHVLFWGEAQLQTLIDKGRTPLPVFGTEDEPTADLIAYGYCLIDSKDADAIDAGFNVGCAALISLAKIVVVGLSLGTGIVGGHFWGPLFVGCVASHLFTDVMEMLTEHTGFFPLLSHFPCVAILCIMGSSHVVTFRAHMAIMLILTLTISAFYPDQEDVTGVIAGDYSAVFPLLVVSCFVSVMATRGAVFYKEQRCRGDIMAAPEVLCEPGKEGTPMVVDYDFDSQDASSFYSSSDDDITDPMGHSLEQDDSVTSSPDREHPLTQRDIEKAFEKAQQAERADREASIRQIPAAQDAKHGRRPSSGDLDNLERSGLERSDSDRKLSVSRRSSNKQEDQLTELLSRPMDPPRRKYWNRHRRVRSTNDVDPSLPPPSFHKTPSHSRSGSAASSTAGGGRRSRANSASSRKSSSEERLMRVTSFGELKDFHPSLFDGARQRAASVSRPPSIPKSGRHSRRNSEASQLSDSVAMMAAATSNPGGASLPQDDVERSYGPSPSNNTTMVYQASHAAWT